MMGLINVTDDGSSDSYAKISKYQSQQCWRGSEHPTVAFTITGNFTARRFRQTLRRVIYNKTFFGRRIIAFALAKIQAMILAIPGGQTALYLIGLAIGVFVVVCGCQKGHPRQYHHAD